MHAKKAFENKATVYAPSIFFSKKGIENGHQTLEAYAKKYGFNILMSNYSGKHWNITAGGKSAFWNTKGEKIKELNTSKEALLIAEKTTTSWSVKSIQL